MLLGKEIQLILPCRFWCRIPGENTAKLLRHIGAFLGDVLRFLRIEFVVVELQLGGVFRGTRYLPLDQAVTFRANGATELLIRVGVKRMISDPGSGIFEHRNEAESINGLWSGGRGESSEFGECGKNIHGFDEVA